MAVGNGGYAALTAFGAPAATGHLGRGARLVDEDKPRRVEFRLIGAPRQAPRGDVWPFLLAGVRCFYGMARPNSPASDMKPVSIREGTSHEYYDDWDRSRQE